ncbi:MAG: c-type cytochrome domain-containing protein, partial [Planctomycetota bacterium]
MHKRIISFVLLSSALHGMASAQLDSPIPIADVKRDTPVDFGKDILPLLNRNCVACHRSGQAEGGLNLSTHTGVLKGGDSGVAINAKDGNTSLLLLRASGRQDDVMPPEDNDVGAKPFTPDELGLIALWIRQGAKSGSQTAERIEWQPVPETVRTIYSIATSPDGRFVSVARANRVAIHDAVTGAQLTKLVDPSIESTSGPNATSVDMIQSIAFSPDGQRLATGGFRTVRIWKRDFDRQPLAGLVSNKSAGRVAYHPTSGNVAIVNAVGDIEVYTSANDLPIAKFSGNNERITGLTWAGDRLASCDSTGRLLLWDTTSGAISAESNSEAPLSRLNANHDGTRPRLQMALLNFL